MYIYNTTFVVAPELETELLEYLRNNLIPILFGDNSRAMNPELRKVVEAGGEKPGPEHGVSIALGASFFSEESAYFWHDKILMPALEGFHEKFGDQALFFITLLENLSV